MIKRYDLYFDELGYGSVEESPNGIYMLYEDYQALENSIAKLTWPNESGSGPLNRSEEGLTPSVSTISPAVEPDMTWKTPIGSKICFTGENGSDWSIALACKDLIVGHVYTLADTDIVHFGTDVFLYKKPGCVFNSVHFVVVEEAEDFGN